MDHDKGRVRLDGSRKLTIRNRKFVKKIVSPPDLPCQGSQDIPIGSVGDGLGLSVPSDGAVKVNEWEDGIQQDQDQAVHDDAHVVLCGDEDVNILPRVSGQDQCENIPDEPAFVSPTINRPRRERKPNIKYSSEEYDLSAVSAMNRKVLLFGMNVIHGTEIKATRLKRRRKSV